MRWKTPTIEEIAMSAEVGAYQDELDRDDPRFVAPSGDGEAPGEDD